MRIACLVFLLSLNSFAQGAAEPSKSPKELFAEILWQKFVAERDPRLADLEISEKEIAEFAANLSRDTEGERVSLTLDQLSGLARPKAKQCAPVPETWGLDIDQGPKL